MLIEWDLKKKNFGHFIFFFLMERPINNLTTLLIIEASQAIYFKRLNKFNKRIPNFSKTKDDSKNELSLLWWCTFHNVC